MDSGWTVAGRGQLVGGVGTPVSLCGDVFWFSLPSYPPCHTYLPTTSTSPSPSSCPSLPFYLPLLLGQWDKTDKGTDGDGWMTVTCCFALHFAHCMPHTFHTCTAAPPHFTCRLPYTLHATTIYPHHLHHLYLTTLPTPFTTPPPFAFYPLRYLSTTLPLYLPLYPHHTAPAFTTLHFATPPFYSHAAHAYHPHHALPACHHTTTTPACHACLPLCLPATAPATHLAAYLPALAPLHTPTMRWFRMDVCGWIYSLNIRIILSLSLSLVVGTMLCGWDWVVLLFGVVVLFLLCCSVL